MKLTYSKLPGGSTSLPECVSSDFQIHEEMPSTPARQSGTAQSSAKLSSAKLSNVARAGGFTGKSNNISKLATCIICSMILITLAAVVTKKS